jgi:hypothetical protein
VALSEAWLARKGKNASVDERGDHFFPSRHHHGMVYVYNFSEGSLDTLKYLSLVHDTNFVGAIVPLFDEHISAPPLLHHSQFVL